MSSTTRTLVKGSMFRSVNFFGQVLAAFFLVPFIVHALGDRMYGFWALVGSLIGYYGLLDLGLSSAVHRYIGGAIGEGDMDECNRVFNNALFVFTLLGVVALIITTIIAFLSPLFVSNPEDAELFKKVILLLGVNMVLSLTLRTYADVIISKLRFDIISVIDIFTLILRTALILLTLSYGYKVLGLALATVISSIPRYILYVVFAKRTLPSLQLKRKYIDKGTIKKLFSYSSFSFIAQMAGRLRIHTDVFVITAFMSLSMVTHYRVASLMVQYFSNLIGQCLGVLAPLFSQQFGAGHHETIRKTLFFSTKIAICFSSFVGFMLIALGRPFIERWMGPAYLDAYAPLSILVIGTLFALWQAPSVSLMYGTSRHKILSLLNSAEGIANVLLSILLVRYYGLIGAAIGTLIPLTFTQLIILPICFCRATSIPYTEYLRLVTKTLGIVFISLLVPVFISFKYATPAYNMLFAVGLISFCIYSLSIWYILFSSAERDVLLQAVLPKLKAERIKN